MSRTTINLLIDITLLLFFGVLIWVTYVLRVAFPAPTSADHCTLWGVSYDGWADLQFALLNVLLLGLLLHVMMHWSWVCGVIANRVSRWRGTLVRADEGAQTIYGVATLIVVGTTIGLALAAAVLSVQVPV